MRNKIVTIMLSAAVIVSLVFIGCAPEAAPPEEEVAPPEEEEEVAPPAAPEAEVIKWKCQCPIPTGIMQFDSWSSFADRVDAMSNGGLKIDVMPGGSVVPEYEEIFAVEEGSLDAYIGQPTDNSGVLGPAADLFTQFACSPTPTEYLYWLTEGDGMSLLQELYDSKGFKHVKVLAFFADEGGEEALVSTKKISTLDDFKGMKIRTYGYWGKVLERLGASVVTLPGAELYHSLKTGVIDACEYSTPAINRDMHFYEVCKYVYYPPYHSPACTYFLWVNKDSWEALPADLQAIVEEAAKAQIIHYWMDAEKQSVEALDFYKDYGVEFSGYSMEIAHAIVTNADGLWEELSKEDPFFDKVYHNQRDFVKSYSEYLKYMVPDIEAARAWGK